MLSKRRLSLIKSESASHPIAKFAFVIQKYQNSTKRSGNINQNLC
ncbi:MAG: hypothetical protein AVDCRST_MAG74-619 [uncultured Pyrinomonadaceae bacterium]|uniref:Uncharacterized protein n=1 Tax=uncultured Pyrinomonadaceae bacterium TaxID=2283094 RepID=A0A6J4NJJ0_9BACT|nr:MAG: hypothetical protein AVDCRST_MAG74-619 [uncultured Pyrinomonadaceae bacterium]